MSRTLPYPPSLTHLRKEAKTLRRAASEGDEDAVRRIEQQVPRLSGRGRSARLSDAQHAVARDYGFASWPDLKSYVLAQETHRILIRRAALLAANRTSDAVNGITLLLAESPQLAAILIIAVGQETAAQLMKDLPASAIEELAGRVAALQAVTAEQEDEAVVAFEAAAGGAEVLETPTSDVEAELAVRRSAAQVRRLRNQCSECVSRIRAFGDRDSDALERSKRLLTSEWDVDALMDRHRAGGSGAGSDPERLKRELAVLEQLEHTVHGDIFVSRGGPEFVRGALVKILGAGQADRMMNRMMATPPGAFQAFRHLGVEAGVGILSKLTPSEGAGVLCQLEGYRSLTFFSGLPEDRRSMLIEHLSEWEAPDAEAIASLERTLNAAMGD
jgi:hypothetical protein